MITIAATLAYLIVGGGSPEELSTENAGWLLMFAALIFAGLAIWVFSIGLLITLGQLIFGVVKLFSAEQDKTPYKHHCYGAIVAVGAYLIIFLSAVIQS